MHPSTVTNNSAAHRFELTAEGATGILVYRREPDTITFVHTEVPPALEGRGIAKELAVAGLEFARAEGLSVVPLCPFVAGFITRHPEYLGLVRDDHRDRLKR